MKYKRKVVGPCIIHGINFRKRTQKWNYKATITGGPAKLLCISKRDIRFLAKEFSSSITKELLNL